MAYFPFFVDIEGKHCLIAGGGSVAYRKVLVLKDYGPVIYVAAPYVIPELRRLMEEEGEKLIWLHRDFEESDLEKADFVVAGTSDELLNERISLLCRERKIPVNVVDDQEKCSFIFPALIREGDITVGISTAGSAPSIAQYLKKKLKEAIPSGLGELARQLGSYRGMVKEEVDSPSLRMSIFKEMAEEGIRQGGTFTREQAKELIERKLAENEK
ncbi:MAG: bifunctional precorrin-2 dehydrogenase/sirohydrochlorin ferrochelatase [Lacrimispora sp.]|uniref:precorrin-2 dehydrogenase/sirohydrochlorin ferrochelatase family protein n=1 Tax=Lacrimispora sp. TaxID=2719234 RepID=UPI0039E40B75